MNSREDAVNKMVAWIERNIAEPVTYLDMARQIGYSPAYCSTVFHRYTGLTLREYAMQRRLFRAAVAIRDTEQRLIDIALDCGYSSHEALTTAFRRQFGLSPQEYRSCRNLIRLPLALSLKTKQEVHIPMSVTPATRVEYIPAHWYLGVFKPTEANGEHIWPGHDCDLVTHTVESMAYLSDVVVPAHTAGWVISGDERSYFYGLGVPEGYAGVIPAGFELRKAPGRYYLVVSHPPFEYPAENADVMQRVEAMAFDSAEPPVPGFRWCREGHCYQRHSPEWLGYQVLRPIERV